MHHPAGSSSSSSRSWCVHHPSSCLLLIIITVLVYYYYHYCIIISIILKRQLTPKSRPPAEDELTKLKAGTPSADSKNKGRCPKHRHTTSNSATAAHAHLGMPSLMEYLSAACGPRHARRCPPTSCMVVPTHVMHGGAHPRHAWRCPPMSCMAVPTHVMHGGAHTRNA